MKVLKNAFVGVAASVLASCQSVDVYNVAGPRNGDVLLGEAPDYSTQRTRIYDQPIECTVTTYEEGRVRGGRTVYSEGRARRTCVSEPDYGRRYRGSSVEQATDQIDDVTDLIYAGRRLQRALDF